MMDVKGAKVVEHNFITIEGGEGAGKTTVIKLVEEKLRQAGYEVLVTREPGGISTSEKIREIVLHSPQNEMEERTEALLFAAARRQHLVQKVKPAIKAGKIVLCDRFIDSSLAYQGYARGIGIDEVYKINEFAIDTYMPALTIFFDITPEEGLKRINANEEREVNRLDLEKIDFHQRVYDGYQLLLQQFSDRIQSVNAMKTVEEVTDEVYTKIITHLKGEVSI